MAIETTLKKIVDAVEQIGNQFGGPGTIEVPIGSFVLASTGGPLAVFADSANNPSVPGIQVTDSEARTIRWNNAATTTGVMATVPMPRDLDTTAGATLYIHCSKVGATVGDACTFAVGAFNQVVGALHDADADFGGNTGAITGDAATKTIQRVSRALAAGDLAAYPASTTFTIDINDGLLGTDDLVLHRVYIAYTKKNPLSVQV